MIEAITKEYTVTRLDKNNLMDLARLHAEVYDLPVNEDLFYKKYDTAYTGIRDIGFIAYNQDQVPVAYYGVIPCFLKYGDNLMLSAQSADTMTHPQYRYKGMFEELSKMTFELCIQSGIKLVFGFPNQNSYHGAVNKLGWQLMHRMDCFIINVNSLPLEKVSLKAGFFGNIYKSYTNALLKSYLTGLKGIESSALSEGFGGVHRSTGYLNNRTYNETKVISIDDVNIWIHTRQGLAIGDLEGVNETNFNKVITGLKRMAFLLGKRQLQFHISPGTNLHALFASAYPTSPSFHALYQDFGSSIPPEKLRFTFADIDIF